MNTIQEFVDAIGKGTFGICIVTCTEPKMNKRGNKYYGRVRKITLTTNVALGYDYANYLYGKAKKQGTLGERTLSDIKNEVSKPFGKSWEQHPYILKSDKDDSQKYLRCYYNSNSKSKSVYLLDGVFVTDERLLEDIKSWIKSSTSRSEKFDIDDVNLRDFKVENVLCLTQGKKIFNKFSNIFTHEQIYNFIKKLS